MYVTHKFQLVMILYSESYNRYRRIKSLVNQSEFQWLKDWKFRGMSYNIYYMTYFSSLRLLWPGSVRTLCAWPLHHPLSAGDTSRPACLRYVRSQMGRFKVSSKVRWYKLTRARGLAFSRVVVPLTRIWPCWAEPPSKRASPLFHLDLATSLFVYF